MKLPQSTFEVAGPDTKPVTAVFPAKGQILLTVTPPGAQILVDGVSLGPFPRRPSRSSSRRALTRSS